MKFAELKTKEIVSVATGKKIGFAEDIIIDETTNSVVALRVPKAGRAFRKTEYIEILFSEIDKIGENVILVNDVSKSCGDTNMEVRGEFYYTPKIFKRSEKSKNN